MRWFIGILSMLQKSPVVFSDDWKLIQKIYQTH